MNNVSIFGGNLADYATPAIIVIHDAAMDVRFDGTIEQQRAAADIVHACRDILRHRRDIATDDEWVEADIACQRIGA